MNRLLPYSLLLLLLPLLIAGCNSRPPRRNQTVAGTAPELQDNLTLAMELLHRIDELDPTNSRQQASYHLNEWVKTVSADADPQWTADVLFLRVPSKIRGLNTVDSLDKMTFHIDDARFLEEAIWLHDVSQLTVREPAPEPFRSWLDEQIAAGHDVEPLASAERMFDWTIRNIQLDPLLPYPATPVAVPGASGDKPVPPAPRRGEPGPGYQYHPWQTMLYGHGDAWQRARVFMLMCRQQGLDSVMLAINDNNLNPAPFPWITGVLLDQKLYLFDTELGLPIPSADGRGVATLQEVIANPRLLSSLDIEKQPYRVGADQLDKLVALVDASSYALSKRMIRVESRLAGKNRLGLVVEPSRLARELKKIPAITGTRIWTVPFETEMFRRTITQRSLSPEQWAKTDIDGFTRYYREEAILADVHPLVLGRRAAFRGEFDKSNDKDGARTFYMQARPPDHVIDTVGISEVSQARLGVRGSIPMEEPAKTNAVRNAQVFYRQCKLHATYWMGLVQYETGNHDSAVEWFERRTLTDQPESPWVGGARYNLGRVYEALGQWDKARQTFLEDTSPQRQGNVNRARLIKRRMAK